jgi:hypothetical protein
LNDKAPFDGGFLLLLDRQRFADRLSDYLRSRYSERKEESEKFSAHAGLKAV